MEVTGRSFWCKLWIYCLKASIIGPGAFLTQCSITGDVLCFMICRRALCIITETYRNPQALGCSAPSTARVLLGAKEFL